MHGRHVSDSISRNPSIGFKIIETSDKEPKTTEEMHDQEKGENSFYESLDSRVHLHGYQKFLVSLAFFQQI